MRRGYSPRVPSPCCGAVLGSLPPPWAPLSKASPRTGARSPPRRPRLPPRLRRARGRRFPFRPCRGSVNMAAAPGGRPRCLLWAAGDGQALPAPPGRAAGHSGEELRGWEAGSAGTGSSVGKGWGREGSGGGGCHLAWVSTPGWFGHHSRNAFPSSRSGCTCGGVRCGFCGGSR